MIGLMKSDGIYISIGHRKAFSVVQGAGKGCTIRQDRLVGFKDHGFKQKGAIAEAIENLPNGRHHGVM
jgi:hypothetical protein